MKLRNFGADWCGLDNLNNINHGYIKKVTPKKLAEKANLKKILKYQDDLNGIGELEKKLRESKAKV